MFCYSILISYTIQILLRLCALNCQQISFLEFFYMLGMSTTLFILAMLLVGGLGDYLKNIFKLTQINVLVMAIGCTVSVIPYVSITIHLSCTCHMNVTCTVGAHGDTSTNTNQEEGSVIYISRTCSKLT